MRLVEYRKKRKAMRTGCLLILTMILLVACDGGNALQPKSGGRPYEVLTVDDRDSIIYKVLDKDVDGLPQREPSFDISSTDGVHFDQTARTARAVVKVTEDSTLYTETRIRYERNVYARPQIIVYITTPSRMELGKAMGKDAAKLRNLLTNFEMGVETAILKKKHNPRAEEKIRKMFGVEMLVPADMQSDKTGKDFIWLSNNTGSGMQNICIYSAASLDVTRVRDSVMRKNIPGERRGMYMKTNAASVIRQKMTAGDRRLDKVELVRGLWEMENDAMGGPFVLHVFRKGDRYIYAEAFVYAPEMKKRNKIRQTEAALYSIKK